MQDRDKKSPEVQRREESERGKPRERENQKKCASGGTGLDDCWINPETENPVGLKIKGDFEAEARADDDAKSDDQWDGEHVGG